MDDQKLCNIQKEFGHEALSYVCRSFPRSRNNFFGIKEECLSLACPSAAELILGAEKPLELNLHEIDTQPIEILANITPSNEHWGLISANTAWALRTLVFRIIQERKINFNNRLMILGLLTQNLDQELASEDDTRCKQVLAKFESLIADPNSIESLISGVPKSFETKLLILKSLIKEIEPFTIANPEYRIYLKMLADKLNLNKGFTETEESQHYHDLNKFTQITDERELLLENYCFQLIYKEMFPFSSKLALDQFLQLALRIFLIREHLKYSLRETNNEKSESIRLIQKFTRLYEHAPKLRKTLKTLLGDLQFDTLPHLLIILNAD